MRFLVVITAHNCRDYLHDLVQGLASQTVRDWRAVFVDDASTDGSVERLRDLLRDRGLAGQFIVVCNTKRQYKARNAFEAIRRHGQDDDIVVLHDGDDHLANPDALKTLSIPYQQGWQVVWSAWQGSNGDPGNSYYLNPLLRPRFQPWVSSHLFSFRKPLFDAIEPVDLQYENGEWLPEACDQAIALPILEQTIRRKFIPEVLYSYNRHNPLNINKQGEAWRDRSSKAQARTAIMLRRRKGKSRATDVSFVIRHSGYFICSAVLNLALVQRFGRLIYDAWHFRQDRPGGGDE
jgi:glycosyltransferase involved in cell wall biosynthesis